MSSLALGLLFLSVRIIMLGTERIFLKRLEDYDSLTLTGLFFLLASVFLLPVLLIPTELALTIPELLYLISSATIYSLGFYAYVRALSLGDASLVAPLYNSSLLWLFFLGGFFLGEQISVYKVIGGLLMFFGVFILHEGSVREKLTAIRKSKASVYMIVGSLFIAIGRTIDTFVTSVGVDVSITPEYYAFLLNLAVGVIILLFATVRGQLSPAFRVLRSRPYTVSAAAVVNGWSYLFLLLAISQIGVTVAEPASLLSVFVTAVLARYFLGEKVGQRIPGMVAMVIGAILLSIAT